MSGVKTIKGFTLIELLVVISIIGLLSSVILSSLNTTRSKARDAQRISTLQQIGKALELYYGDNGHYPIATFDYSLGGNVDGDASFIGMNNTWKSNLSTKLSNGKYIATAEQDPQNNSLLSVPPILSGKGYAYWTTPTGSKYQLMGRLENKNNIVCSNTNYIATVPYGAYGPIVGTSLCGNSNYNYTTRNVNLYVISGNGQ